MRSKPKRMKNVSLETMRVGRKISRFCLKLSRAKIPDVRLRQTILCELSVAINDWLEIAKEQLIVTEIQPRRRSKPK